MTAFILWSGGKESYLSYKEALKEGLKPEFAVSYVDQKSKRLLGCHVREEAVKKQAEKLRLKFVPVYVSKRKGNVLENLEKTLKNLKVSSGIFGIVSDTDNREKLENVMRKLKIDSVFPLWNKNPEEVSQKVINFTKSLIVCRKLKAVPKRFLGKYFNPEFINFLKESKLSLLGENGEFQTFVVSCEEFSLNVKILKTFRRSLYECIDFEV